MTSTRHAVNWRGRQRSHPRRRAHGKAAHNRAQTGDLIRLVGKIQEALHGGNGWTLAADWPLDTHGMRCGGLHLGASGCATNTSPAVSDADAGLVTPSDEPESRRRARIRLELASNYFELGQTAVALDEVKQSLSADPSYADAFNLRGLIYMRLNDYPQAEDSFRRALSLRANDANILHNYGWLMPAAKVCRG